MTSFQGRWEKRWHPLCEEWIVYSAHRNSRPWHGAPPITTQTAPDYNPSCYLCPGNARVHGHQNPTYTDVFIFENDHPVVGMNAPEVLTDSNPLFRKASAKGIAKVVCYDPRHNITLAQMKLSAVVNVFHAFQSEMMAFEKNPAIHSVLIFENKGEAVGVSNPHPHCQIYATDFPLKLVSQQLDIAHRYSVSHHKNIFNEIIEYEIQSRSRIIAENKHAVAFIPFFARYAYEVMIFPKRHHQTLISLTPDELHGLAAAFHDVVRKLDMNFQLDFPYVMSIMQAPVDGHHYENFRMHLWLQPPYRQPGLIKYLAGPEIGAGNFMADTMPEEKAAELQKIDLTLYSLER